jgi:hypothetical protein
MNNQQILLAVTVIVIVAVLLYMHRQNDFLPKKKVSCINPDLTQMKHIKSYLAILSTTYGILSSNFVRCAQINDLPSSSWSEDPFFLAIVEIRGAIYRMDKSDNLNDMYSQLQELTDTIKTLDIDFNGEGYAKIIFRKPKLCV